jgi:ADP-ribose pyrophosphatase
MAQSPLPADFQIIDRQPLHDGFFRIDRLRLIQRQHDGGWSRELSREIIFAREAVAVMLYDAAHDTVVLIEQARLPAAFAGFPAMQTEVVAGLIEAGEDAIAVARREVAEETGTELLGDPIPVVRMLSSPGSSTETVNVFCARVDSATVPASAGLASEDEDIRPIIITVEEMLTRIAEGRISNGFTILAGYWLLANRDRLQRLWG